MLLKYHIVLELRVYKPQKKLQFSHSFYLYNLRIVLTNNFFSTPHSTQCHTKSACTRCPLQLMPEVQCHHKDMNDK